MYSAQRQRERSRRKAYQALVFDSLQNIPQGKYIPQRLEEILRPRQEIDVDAIIDHVAALLSSEEP